MRKELLGVFSGFPDHHFPEEIAKRLREELTERGSIVFITACPQEYEQNDDDCEGMYQMFVEKGMSFAKHCVIDERTQSSEAKELVQNASCIFLMGGGACMDQLELIRGKDCLSTLRDCHAVILGLSAGSMNMARDTVDFHDSMIPFEGLGFTNLTVSCHHDPADTWRYEQTLRMSEDRVVYAMEDESAFFIKAGRIDIVGNVYRVEHGKLQILGEEGIRELEQDEFRKVFDTKIYYDDGLLKIRSMIPEDAKIFYDTYLSYNWHPQMETYENYYREQETGERLVFIPEYEGKVAGICTLVLKPTEGPLAGKGWPEIVDFGVFFHLHKRGIGNKILDVVEVEAAQYADHVFLAVGLHSGYGAAQRIYVKRGYIPDGSGVWYQGKQLEQYVPCVNDDDLLLFLEKKLK